MIREATPADVPALLSLVQGLATYEREPDAVEATEAGLAEVLFRDHPLVHALVATASEDDAVDGGGAGAGPVVGMAIWYLAFSTWTGSHSLYLEDLFVRPEHRRAGYGRALLEALARKAVELGCARLEWAVLDWNEPAKAFYRSVGARHREDWEPWRLAGAELAALAGPGDPGDQAREAAP